MPENFCDKCSECHMYCACSDNPLNYYSDRHGGYFSKKTYENFITTLNYLEQIPDLGSNDFAQSLITTLSQRIKECKPTF